MSSTILYQLLVLFINIPCEISLLNHSHYSHVNILIDFPLKGKNLDKFDPHM